MHRLKDEEWKVLWVHPGYHGHIPFSMLFGGASGKGIHYHTAYSIGTFFIKKERRGKDDKTQI